MRIEIRYPYAKNEIIQVLRSLEKRRSKKQQRFQELHHPELQTNTSFNEQLKEMLPIINDSNHSTVVRTSTNKDIEISIFVKI